MIKPVKVFSEDNHSSKKFWVDYLIHPIRAYWGDGTNDWGKYESDFLFYKKYFSITTIPSECDIGFLPLELNYYIKNSKIDLVDRLANTLDRVNKRLLIWVEGDNEIRYTHPNCIFIKYFGEKSKNSTNEIVQPGDLKYDLLEHYYNGQIQLKDKCSIPLIGFDGIATYPLAKVAYGFLKRSLSRLKYDLYLTRVKNTPLYPSYLKRKFYLSLIERSKLVDTRFTLRNSFALGTMGGNDESRLDFIHNIISSDYTFCLRGGGNYSLRFYETLCLGRIPLFINTDCVLPFEDEINWQDVCLWVEEKDIDSLDTIILDHYSSFTNDQFKERQIYCREIWKKYLSKEGFAIGLNQHIKKYYID